MTVKFSQGKHAGSPGNRFARHPVASVTILLVITFLFCLLALEFFLRTFSGLGNPPLYELSPLYGYRLKANQSIEPRGGFGPLYGARLTTNNLGLRAANNWDSNPAGKILFLGDSVTYGGQYVADNELFSVISQSNLSGWQTGNGGINAWGVENIVGLVKDFEFTPAEVVVTSIIEGDFYRGLTRASSMPLWTERPEYALQDLLMHFIWRINMSRYGNNVAGIKNDTEHLDKIVNRAVRRLKQLNEYLEREHIKHFIFILPTRSQLVDNEPPDPRVEQLLQKYGIHVEYLLPLLAAKEPDKQKRRAWFHDEAHLEESGHQIYGILIGDILANVLSDN